MAIGPFYTIQYGRGGPFDNISIWNIWIYLYSSHLGKLLYHSIVYIIVLKYILINNILNIFYGQLIP